MLLILRPMQVSWQVAGARGLHAARSTIGLEATGLETSSADAIKRKEVLDRHRRTTAETDTGQQQQQILLLLWLLLLAARLATNRSKSIDY